MNSATFLLFRAVLLETLLLQALYSPAEPPGAGLWLFLGCYAAFAGAVYLLARRGRLGPDREAWSFVIDIAVTSLVLYGTKGVSEDFYVAYFLVILVSCLMQKPALSFLAGGVACLVYGSLVMPALDWKTAPTHLLRLSLLLATTFFSSCVVDSARAALHGVERGYADRLAWLERLTMAGRIVSAVLHDLKTPINTILLSAERARGLMGSAEGRPRADEALRLIEDEAERVAGILVDYLDFTSPTELEMSDVGLRPLVETAYRKVSFGIDPKAVEFDNRVAEAAVIRGSERHLVQVFMNLFDNAIEAMPLGGRLTVSAGRQDGRWRVEIADTGVGLSSAQARRLFEPFVSSRPEEGGHGLGLYVSRWIVRNHGGELQLQSRGPKRGCVASLSIPAGEKS